MLVVHAFAQNHLRHLAQAIFIKSLSVSDITAMKWCYHKERVWHSLGQEIAGDKKAVPRIIARHCDKDLLFG